MNVVHINDLPPGALDNPEIEYIGRSAPRRKLAMSIWHNPFRMLNETQADRERVIRAYRAYVLARPALLASLPDLDGVTTLVCWCKPLDCHGDVLNELYDGYRKCCKIKVNGREELALWRVYVWDSIASEQEPKAFASLEQKGLIRLENSEAKLTDLGVIWIATQRYEWVDQKGSGEVIPF